MIYTVYSLDMWGHVSADCKEHDCPCMHGGEHNDNVCVCSEDCNASYRAGEIELDGESPLDEAILDALLYEGFLTAFGRKVATVEDFSDGPLEINDDVGRRLLYLEPEGQDA